MTQAGKYLAILFTLLVPLAVTPAALAAGETVAAESQLTPRSGNFFKQVRVASNLTVSATVTPGATSATVNPTKRMRFTFPAGMTLNPNRNVCPDNKLGPGTNLSLGPAYVVNQCPKAVVGTGTAMIYLAKFKVSPLNDPVLVAFNAGKNRQGQPKLKIYGYSKQTTVGILMNATLRGRVLDIAVPVLSSDSAVGEFKLEMPGPRLQRPELSLDTRGLNPYYVQALCSSSPLVTDATFELGERDVSTGQPTSSTVTVNAPETTQNCTGLTGRPKLTGARAKGPKRLVRARKATFFVTVKNAGTATARSVKVRVSGGGRGFIKAANIQPRSAKTIRVKVRPTTRKGRVARLVFTISAGSSRTKAVARARVVR